MQLVTLKMLTVSDCRQTLLFFSSCNIITLPVDEVRTSVCSFRELIYPLCKLRDVLLACVTDTSKHFKHECSYAHKFQQAMFSFRLRQVNFFTAVDFWGIFTPSFISLAQALVRLILSYSVDESVRCSTTNTGQPFSQWFRKRVFAQLNFFWIK
jgi:hypothetical protein